LFSESDTRERQAIGIVILTLASLLAVACVGVGIFWLYSSKRKSREDTAAAAVEMTSAFGDVLDGINDGDDGDDFDDDDAIFTFASGSGEGASVPAADGKKEVKESLITPPALEVPKTSDDLFTIEGIDDDADVPKDSDDK